MQRPFFSDNFFQFTGQFRNANFFRCNPPAARIKLRSRPGLHRYNNIFDRVMRRCSSRNTIWRCRFFPTDKQLSLRSFLVENNYRHSIGIFRKITKPHLLCKETDLFPTALVKRKETPKRSRGILVAAMSLHMFRCCQSVLLKVPQFSSSIINSTVPASYHLYLHPKEEYSCVSSFHIVVRCT